MANVNHVYLSSVHPYKHTCETADIGPHPDMSGPAGLFGVGAGERERGDLGERGDGKPSCCTLIKHMGVLGADGGGQVIMCVNTGERLCVCVCTAVCRVCMFMSIDMNLYVYMYACMYTHNEKEKERERET